MAQAPFDPAALVETVPFTPDGVPRPIRATPYRWRDPATIPPREWLYGRHLIRRFLSTTVAPGAVGKSSLALVEAIAMVTGRPLLGVPTPRCLRVWYVNLEDPLEEAERMRVEVFGRCRWCEGGTCRHPGPYWRGVPSGWTATGWREAAPETSETAAADRAA